MFFPDYKIITWPLSQFKKHKDIWNIVNNLSLPPSHSPPKETNVNSLVYILSFFFLGLHKHFSDKNGMLYKLSYTLFFSLKNMLWILSKPIHHIFFNGCKIFPKMNNSFIPLPHLSQLTDIKDGSLYMFHVL